MNILQDLFTSETVTDIFILKFGLFFSLLLLLPYLSLVIGSLFFSLLHVTKSKLFDKEEYFLFAQYSIKMVVDKIWVRLFFGVIPFFGVAFFYTQIFTKNVSASENLFFAFLLFFAALCITVVYKGSFKLNKNVKETIKFKTFSKSGWFAILLFLLSSYILIGYLNSAIEFSSNSDVSLSASMFSVNSIITYLLFLTITFSLTSAVIVARLNRTVENYSFKEYGREFSSKTGILFTFVQPLIYVVFVFSINSLALSFSFFFASMLALILMLIISIQFYINYKKNDLKSTSIVFLFILLFSVLIYSNQLTSEKVNNREAIKQGTVFNIFS